MGLLEALAGQAVRVYDPSAKLDKPYPGVDQTETALDACQGAHALVIMTGWDEFATINTKAVKDAMAQRLIIDPSGVWSRRGVSADGFHYYTLGSPPWRHHHA